MPSLRFLLLFYVFLLSTFPSAPRAEGQTVSSTMTNHDVIELVGAGLPDDIVIAKIHAAGSTAFDTSVSGLTSLKRANVSASVIRVIMNPRPAEGANSADALDSTPAAPSTGRCPNISGHWYTSNAGGLAMDVVESNCSISSNNMDSRAGFHHTIRGTWEPSLSSFSWTIARLDPQHCWSHLYGRATVTGPSTFNVDIFGSDGRCGMPTNYTEHGTFARQ